MLLRDGESQAETKKIYFASNVINQDRGHTEVATSSEVYQQIVLYLKRLRMIRYLLIKFHSVQLYSLKLNSVQIQVRKFSIIIERF